MTGPEAADTDAPALRSPAGAYVAASNALLRLVQEVNRCAATGAPCEADWRSCACDVERSEREQREKGKAGL